LVHRQISSYCIKKGIEEIAEEEYVQTLTDLIQKKANMLSGENVFVLKQKAATYVIGKGFESELVWDILNDKF
jgi:regulatory protein